MVNPQSRQQLLLQLAVWQRFCCCQRVLSRQAVGSRALGQARGAVTMAGALEMDSEAWVENQPWPQRPARALCKSVAAARAAGAGPRQRRRPVVGGEIRHRSRSRSHGRSGGSCEAAAVRPGSTQPRYAVGVRARRQARSAEDSTVPSDSAAAAAGLPPGPANLEEALLCLGDVAERVVARAAAAKVDLARADTDTLGQIIWLTSSYSGMGCAEAAAGAVRRHLADRGVKLIVRAHSATDYAPLCRQVLLAHRADAAPAHIMANILDRIPDTLRDKLLRLAARLRRRCSRHARVVELAHGAGAAAATRAAQVAELGAGYVARVREQLSKVQFSADQTAWCEKHQCRCQIAPVRAAADLLVEVAGTTCVAWSSMGGGWGWLDESALPCLVWVSWMKASLPDVIIHEITPRFSPDALQSMLGDRYNAASMVTSPVDWGIPSSRPRRYTVFLLKTLELRRARPEDNIDPVSGVDLGEVVCGGGAPAVSSCGSSTPDSLEDGPWPVTATGEPPEAAQPLTAAVFRYTSENVRQLSSRALQLDSSAYLVAEPCQVARYRASRAARRLERLGQPPDDEGDDNDSLPIGYRVHLEAYDAVAKSRGCCDMANLTQSPYHLTPSARQIAPTLLKASLLYSLSRRRLLHPGEYFLIMGMPSPSMLGAGSRAAADYPFTEAIEEQLPENAIRQLAGNGMHLCQIGTVFLIAVGLAAELQRRK